MRATDTAALDTLGTPGINRTGVTAGGKPQILVNFLV